MDIKKPTPPLTPELLEELHDGALKTDKAKREHRAPAEPISGRSLRIRTKTKRSRGATKRPQKDRWYKMVSFFENEAQAVMQVNNENILLCGWVPPDKDCAVVLVPPSVTHEQGLALQKIMEANLRKPCLVLTNNTQLVKLRAISDGEADKIMKEGAGGQGEIVQVERREVEQGAGPELRAEAGQPDEGDLRLTDPSEGDGGGAEGEGSEAAPPASEGERGSSE